ncbi:lymphoid-specific helicase-like [Ischnura elegans]|uniref:lymphoid-specific helicase-like n=1 Tax=Ischnura elegans TaxID=197161 RepID=UPI001ED8BBA8|nr:lymphoid-specific helicase-like [Ischnura elegans]
MGSRIFKGNTADEKEVPEVQVEDDGEANTSEKPKYEADVDEKRFLAFKKMMEHSEVYADFLKQKMVSQVDTRKFEWIRKQALMKNMAETYKKQNIKWEKYAKDKMPDPDPNDPFSILREEMLNAGGQVVPMKQPFLLENASLREYQIEGLNWLKTLFEYGINGILADEMGLGKTIQSIAVIAHLYEMGVAGHYLVVAPLSTIYNWVSEFQRFAPKIPILMYHGVKDRRLELRNELKPVEVLGVKVMPVVITSYEMVIKDQSFFKALKWRYMVVDEGHRLKNFKCRLVSVLKSFNSGCRLLLTGTPLQNNLSELWSLMNFLMPEVFGEKGDAFESLFNADGLMASENCNKIIKMERDNQLLTTMHRTLRPFVLRRMKSEVDIFLPPKKEVLVYAPMTDLQKEYYEASLNNSITKVLGLEELEEEKEEEEENESEEEGPPRKKPRGYKLRSTLPKSKRRIRTRVPTGKTSLKMRNITMNLRKIVNHPYLVHFPYHPDTEELKIDEELIQSCGKLLVLDAILKKLQEKGHKVLLFSQMTSLLDVLEEFLDMRSYSYVRFDGSTKVEERQEAIELFKKKETFIFLLSTRAGGLGINLTSADTVIIYDSDWNPQCDFQAIDRCHRIGQTLPVVVYRLITSGTIDERMVELARAKMKLEKMVIEKGQFRHKDENVSGISIQELKDLLISGNVSLSIQPNGLVFSDEELDCLLDREAILADTNDLSIASKKNSPMQGRPVNKNNIGTKSHRNNDTIKRKSHSRVYKIV